MAHFSIHLKEQYFSESPTSNLAHLTSEEVPLEQVPALWCLKEASP